MKQEQPRIDVNIERHYSDDREEERLQRGKGRLEFIRTMEVLERFLPAVPARIIDVGGGTGVYAVPLAELGYHVHLIDPIDRHLQQAREAAVGVNVLIEKGDARCLRLENESADAALLLGPLYHLTTKDDRSAALNEARRVLTPGGTIVAAAISRFASTYDALLTGKLDEPEFEPVMERGVIEGQHRNPSSRPEWFTTAYFHRPDELREELTDAGFMEVQLFVVEGPGWVVPDLDAVLDDVDRRERLLRAIRRVEQDPSILGASAHLLGVGRRP